MARDQISRKEVQVSKRLVHSYESVFGGVRVGFDRSTVVGKACAARHAQEEQQRQKLSVASVAHDARFGELMMRP